MTNALEQLQLISAARTPDELWQLLLAAMREYGFEQVSYGYTRSWRNNSIGDAQDALFLTNSLDSEAREIFDMAFLMRTPMFRWVMANTGACSWRWATEQRALGRLSADEVVAMDQSRRAGVVAGYSIAFSDPSPRSKGGMGLSARSGVMQDAVDAMWATRGTEIMAICNMFHLRLIQMPFRNQRRPLSPRQRETLEWVADGKTTQDIAAIMGISAAMVEKHLRLARESLDVETTAHAVAKAAMLNHIFVDQQPTCATGAATADHAGTQSHVAPDAADPVPEAGPVQGIG